MMSIIKSLVTNAVSVRNVRLSPLSSAFSPGSVVTCKADGNPPPTIRWQSLNTQNVSTWRDIPEANGSQLVVGNDVRVIYRCVASNFVRNSSDSEISCQIAVGETGQKHWCKLGIKVGNLGDRTPIYIFLLHGSLTESGEARA